MEMQQAAIEDAAGVRRYMLDWFDLVRALHAHRRNERTAREAALAMPPAASEATAIPEDIDIERMFEDRCDALIERGRREMRTSPLEILIRKLELSRDERLVLVFVLMKEMNNEHCCVDDLALVLSADVIGARNIRVLLSPSATIRLHELVSIDDSPRRGGFRMRTEVLMRPPVVRWLTTGEGVVHGVNDDDPTPYSSPLEHITDWLHYAVLLRRIARISHDDQRADGDEDRPGFELLAAGTWPRHGLIARKLLQIVNRTPAEGWGWPLLDLVTRYGLTQSERDIVLLLLDAAVTGRFSTMTSVCRVMTPDPLERRKVMELFDEDAPLMRYGLVSVLRTTMQQDEIELSRHVREYLLCRAPALEIGIRELVAADAPLQHVHPEHTFADLILPAHLAGMLRDVRASYSDDVQRKIRHWRGAGGGDRRGEAGASSGQCLLFHGAPGTGKSLAAHALAAELGREILETDCSRLLSKWVGESERNIHNLFETYRRVCLQVERPPVLLLNEADQLLSSRHVRAETSADRMYNQMRNLILDRMEQMEGMLIATTNMIDAIDPAFSRRFHIKLEFPMPDAGARLALWKMHLPRSLPLCADVNLEFVAGRYAFSGGQIRIVSNNAISRSAVHGSELTMKELLAACDLEAAAAPAQQRPFLNGGYRLALQ